MASLHLSDNAPAKPATTNSAVTLQDEASKPQHIDEVSTAGKDLQKESTNVRLTDEQRSLRKVCPCGTLLRKDNSDGLCKVCRKNAKKDASVNRPPAKRGRPRKSKATPPRNSTARVETPANGVATLCVTETHLNNFLLKLSLDEKTSIVQRHLEGV
jgi:hypothetical protein